MNNRFLIALLIICSISLNAFSQTRFDTLEVKLKELSKNVPGLKQRVDFSISGITIQEFLRGIAETNDLNINIDPSINIKIVYNFNNEAVINVLLFLCKEYDIDIRFYGSIMSFYKYIPPKIIETVKDVQKKEIKAEYNETTKKLTVDFKNDSLEHIAKKLSQIGKCNIVLGSGIGDKKITLYLQNLSVNDVLEQLAFANNLVLNQTSDNLYSLENNISSTTQNTNKNSSIKKNDKLNKSNNSELSVTKDSFGNNLINIDVVNKPILDLIKEVSEQTNTKFFLYSEPKGNTTSKVSGITYTDFLAYVLQSTNFTYKKENDVYLIGERDQEGLRETKIIHLKYRTTELLLDIIPADIKKGVEIKKFNELNSLILSGSAPAIADVVNFINQMDKVVPMIQIEVILVDVGKSRETKTGIKAGLSDSVKGGGSILPGVDYTLTSGVINELLGVLQGNSIMNLGRVNNKFYVSLNALEDRSNINVRSTPKLATLNGHEATLSIGRTIYYSIETQNTIGSLTPNTIRTVQWNNVQANLKIKIVPIVSGDEQVTLEIEVENSDFLDKPAANAPPGTSTSQFKSIIRVRNEEMVVLGGLERIENNETGSGVPFLSRIPVIKWFFSSKTKSRKRTKSLVFIKPTVIY